MAEQPIIIKKVKKNSGHAHHGGAWKLAYADFVTAMMAFFLLMWLLGSTTEETRKGIAEYFQDPYKASLMGGQDVGDRSKIIPGGGADLMSREHGQIDEKRSAEYEKAQLANLKDKIEAMIESSSELSKFKEQIRLETTNEGLRVLITDNKNKPMFKLASSETEPEIREILRALAPVINDLPNKISINGHTDARPFPKNQTGYSNWELSSDRANAVRNELTLGGLAEDKVLRVTGLASSIPYNVKDPFDPMNRRISIIVMNKKNEEELLQGAGSKSTPDPKDAASPVKETPVENTPTELEKTEASPEKPQVELPKNNH